MFGGGGGYWDACCSSDLGAIIGVHKSISEVAFSVAPDRENMFRMPTYLNRDQSGHNYVP